MKRHVWQLPEDRALIIVNGGPSNPDGWFIATENHPRVHKHGAPRPWRRRYYPPGYNTSQSDSRWALLRVLPNRHEWWVEPLNVETERLGPYPNRITAWAVWRLMQ
jgi:hypothetical protein